MRLCHGRKHFPDAQHLVPTPACGGTGVSVVGIVPVDPVVLLPRRLLDEKKAPVVASDLRQMQRRHQRVIGVVKMSGVEVAAVQRHRRDEQVVRLCDQSFGFMGRRHGTKYITERARKRNVFSARKGSTF